MRNAAIIVFLPQTKIGNYLRKMNREILKLAVPNILSNISVPLLSTVDTVLMGHLSAAHLGAVGLGSMIFNFIYWNFGFLRMGTTGITAQAYGSADSKSISNTLGRACAMGLGLGVLILVIQFPLIKASNFLMNVSVDQLPLVEQYFYIRILAAPASLMLYGILGWYFGMQNAIYPLILTVFINVINMGISALLVLHFELGVAGVAWGTVVAQYAGLALAIYFLTSKYRSYLLEMTKKSVFQLNQFAGFLRINRDIFIRTVCLTFAFGFFYSQSSKDGELVLASNVILLQLLNWMSYGIDGFAFASESLVGKYVGARNKKKTYLSIHYSFYWAGALAILYSIVFYGLGGYIIRWFSNDVEIVNYTRKYLIWMGILPIVSFASYIWDGIYIGFTASKAMRDTMIISLMIYLGIFYGLQNRFPMSILWISLVGFLFARGLIQTVYFFRSKNTFRVQEN